MPRSDTSTVPEAWSGTFTRRPSAVTTTATGRRSRPLLRPTLAVSDALRPRGRRPCGPGSLACPVDRATTLNPPYRTGARLPSEGAAVARRTGVAHEVGLPGGCIARCAARLSVTRFTPRPSPITNGPSRIDGPFSSTGAAYAPRSLPAVTRLEHDGRAGHDSESGEDPEGLKLDEVLHRQSHQSHRMPAPRVRAMDATSARTQVKRARFVFTRDSVSEIYTLSDRRLGGLPWKIPGFASPPRGGFALDGL